MCVGIFILLEEFLIEDSNNAGGKDNISVVLIRYED